MTNGADKRFAKVPSRAARMNLTARDFRVFVAIGAYADASGQAFPSVATISADTGINRRHVFYAINNLRKSGLLLTARRRDDSGDWGSTLYTIIHDEGVVLNTAPPSAADSTTVVLNTAPGVVPPEGTLTDHLTRPSNTGARRASQTCAGDDESADWFERFWRVYPDRGDQTCPKKPAREKFIGAVKRGADPAAIVRGAENYSRVMARHQGQDRQYVKQPANWLGQKLWEQYQRPPASAQPKFGGML
jgi:hypothetical protein